jgi:hypothetical protein
MSANTVHMLDYTEFRGIRVSPLAIALAEHPCWRWCAGMAAVTDYARFDAGFVLCENPFTVTMGTIEAGKVPSAWFTDGYEYGEFDVKGKVVPHLSDPGMHGWLTWVLQQYLPGAVALPGTPCRVVVVDENESIGVIVSAPTVGEALAAAILLMWDVAIEHGTSNNKENT